MALSLIEFKNSTAGTSSFTATFTNASQAGDVYIICGMWQSGVTLVSLKTNNNDNAVLSNLNGAASPVNSGLGPDEYFIATIANPTVGSTSVTLTLSGAVGFADLGVYLVRGVTGTLTQDQGVSTTNVTVSTGVALSGLTSTLTTAAEFAVGMCVESVQVNSIDTSQTGSAGFTLDTVSAAGTGYSHRITSSTSAVQSAYDVNAGSSADTLVATFYDAASASSVLIAPPFLGLGPKGKFAVPFGPFDSHFQPQPASIAATANDNAAVSQTLGALAGSATAQVLVQASASPTLAALTSSVAAAVIVQASVSQTLGALTCAATATVPDGAAASPTLAALTSSATAQVIVSASASPTLAALTSLSAAADPVSATCAATLGNVTSSATVADPVSASVGATLANLTLSATANTGSANANANDTLGNVTASAQAAVTVQASVTASLNGLSCSATATVPVMVTDTSTLGLLLSSGTIVVLDRAAAAATLAPLQSNASLVHIVPNRHEPAALMI